MSLRPLRASLGVSAALLGLTGCVGPAPTTAGYEEKALRAAEAGLSEVETAMLAVQMSLQGRLAQSYLETMLGESEEALSSIQTTFDSIQPPYTGAADHLQASLDPLLSDGAQGLTQLRILARRQDSAGLSETAAELSTTATDLENFAQEHGG